MAASEETGSMTEYKTILVDRVKRLQRSSHEVKMQWYSYCRKNGTTSFDPGRHDESYLQAFLNTFEGPTAQVEVHRSAPKDIPGGKTYLINRIKEIQRSSPENKKAWYSFCAKQCTANYDPARHDEAFLRTFVENFEESASAALAADFVSASVAASTSAYTPGTFGWDSSKARAFGKGITVGGSSGSSAAASPPLCAGGKGGSCSSTALASADWSPIGGQPHVPGADSDDAWGSAAFMSMMMSSMMKGKMMAKGGFAAAGKGGGGEDGLLAAAFQSGMASGGVIGTPQQLQPRLPPNTVPSGNGAGAGLSEFGILDKPLTQERLNQKRGFGSCSVENGAGGVMDEEQARKFQESLKRRRT